MATSGITPTTGGIPVTNTETRTPVQELGKDQFLQILAVQLANQDPLQPMEDTDFIAQMAQFSSLEQMGQLNDSFGTWQAYSLIGKNVVADTDDGQILGSVTGVIHQGTQQYLQVGTLSVPMSKVREIYDTGHEGNSLTAQSSHLIGKYVQGSIPMDKLDASTGQMVTTEEKIEGTVESILVKDFTVYARIKETGKEIPVSYVTKISDSAQAADAAGDGSASDATDGAEASGSASGSGSTDSETAADGSASNATDGEG